MKKKVLSFVMSSMIFASLVNSGAVNAEDQAEEPPADIVFKKAGSSLNVDDELTISDNNIEKKAGYCGF